MLIIYSPFEWKSYTRRPHWLPASDYYQMLVIEPLLGICFIWLYPRRLLEFIKHRFKIRRGEKGILLFRPFSLGSYRTNYKMPFWAKIDRFLLGWQIRRLLKKLKYPQKMTISCVNKVSQYYLIDLIKDSVKVYEVTDEYRVRTDQDSLKLHSSYSKKMEWMENRILMVADIVFASSRALCDSKSKINPNTYYIPNAADFAHFSKSREPQTIVPRDILKKKRPRLGFIGNINELLDIELLDLSLIHI